MSSAAPGRSDMSMPSRVKSAATSSGSAPSRPASIFESQETEHMPRHSPSWLQFFSSLARLMSAPASSGLNPRLFLRRSLPSGSALCRGGVFLEEQLHGVHEELALLLVAEEVSGGERLAHLLVREVGQRLGAVASSAPNTASVSSWRCCRSSPSAQPWTASLRRACGRRSPRSGQSACPAPPRCIRCGGYAVSCSRLSQSPRRG